MASIRLESVSMQFGRHQPVLHDVDLTIDDGEFMVLVGPSGCGKSTLLRLIAGFADPTAGGIYIAERDVAGVRPRDRDVAMVFQSHALYPHMTVRKNLEFGLERRRVPRDRIRLRSSEVARTLGLETLLDRLPDSLSGGQRQRVAIGRAMIREPAVYLMDEPLSSLDAHLREDMRSELARLHTSLGVTTIYVTHDQTEAMTLGDRVCVLNHGVIQQVGSPRDLYERPSNAFVGGFIGAPRMNFLVVRNTGAELVGGGLRLPVTDRLREALGDRGEVLLGVRPESFQLGGGEATVQVRPRLVEFLGSAIALEFTLDGQAEPLTAVVRSDSQVTVGAPIELGLGTEDVHLFSVEDGESLLHYSNVT